MINPHIEQLAEEGGLKWYALLAMAYYFTLLSRARKLWAAVRAR